MRNRALVATFAVFVFTGVLLSQGRSSAPSTPTQQSIPNFGKLSDPSDRMNVEFQNYDKVPLKLSTTTTYIQVPVIVTDKDEKFVGGLKKEDFSLTENGKPQPVASLEEFFAVGVPVEAPKTRPNEYTNDVDRTMPRRLVIVALDMVNTPVIDQTRARYALIDYVSQGIEPGTLYQLVAFTNDGLKVLHDYTSDSASLIAKLNQVKGRMPTTAAVVSEDLRDAAHPASAQNLTPATVHADSGTLAFDVLALAAFARGEGPYASYRAEEAVQSTLFALQQLAERSSGIPGRKSLVWVTASFPFSVDGGTGAVSQGAAFEGYQHTMQLLSDHQIAIYPVNARGLLTGQFDASMKLSRREVAEPARVLAAQQDEINDVNATMLSFADMTGGRAYINTNDLKGSLQDASRDGARYYLLTYKMDSSDKKQGWRKIGVKSGDYKIRARRGYFATNAALDPGLTAKYDIDRALTSPLDYTGLPLRMVVDPIKDGAKNKKKLSFAMVLAPKMIQVDTANHNNMNVEVAYAISTETGKDAAHKGVNYHLALNEQQFQALDLQGLSYGDSVELDPGRYKVRIVVRDNLSGKIGSVAAMVDVK